MTSPEKNKKKEPSPTLTSLPEDLLLSCLAHVSRLYYPTLSLVSKRFRSLLASRELYKVRSLLGRTENCLYVYKKFNSDPNPSWFILCRKPDQTLTKSSSGYVLAKVRIPDFPSACASGLVVVGSSIYNINGSVSILDCMSHTWHETTSFPLELWSFSSSVIDRKIYVLGCYEDKNGSLKNTFQVLDTKTQIWDPMPFPWIYTNDYIYNSAFIDGKFHVNTRGNVIAYDSKESRWEIVGRSMGDNMRSKGCYCVIENVLYAFSYGKLIWYDTKVRVWRNLKGLERLPDFPNAHIRLTDYGGKMMVLWDIKSYGRCTENTIWCVEIALEKRKNGEVWGEIEWSDNVLTIHGLGYLVKVLVATV